MEYTAQQAAEAARNIGVDLEGEKIARGFGRWNGR